MGWGPIDELSALFAPGMRHEQERRRHQEATGEDVGNASDPPSTVDLERGIAVIRLPRKPAPPQDPPA